MLAYVLDILARIGIYAILAMSLNVICGLTGLLHLGQAGFYAAGAYTAGIVMTYLWIPALGYGNLLLSGVAAMIVAMIFALVIAAPCLRLRGDYLAIATLAFGEIVRLVIENLDFLGGATGLSVGERPAIAWWGIWLAVGATWILLLNVKRSAIGRAFLAIREDEVAAKAMGVNVPLYKTASFLICAAFAGLAGALFAHLRLYMAPKSFGLILSIEVLLMVVLGGLGSTTGAIIAAAMLILLRELLGELPSLPFYLENLPIPGLGTAAHWVWDLPYLGSLLENVGKHRELIFALLLVLLIRYVPDGLLGMKERPEWLARLLRRGKEAHAGG